MRLAQFAVVALCVSSLAARADTIFQLNATTDFGGTVFGTKTLNTASTAFDAADLTYTGSLGNFSTNQIYFQGQGPAYELFVGQIVDGTATGIRLRLCTTSLSGFSGAEIFGLDSTCRPSGPIEYSAVLERRVPDYLISGQVSATPEPSSFALLGTGLLGVAGLVRKRFA